MKNQLVIVVPVTQAKTIKVHLENYCFLDKTWKIKPLSPGCIAIPTILPFDKGDTVDTVRQSLQLSSQLTILQVKSSAEIFDTAPINGSSQLENRLKRRLHDWLSELAVDDNAATALNVNTIPVLLNTFPRRYDIYQPILLFPKTAFVEEPWSSLLVSLAGSKVTELFTMIANSYQVTHVARNAPIPLMNHVNDNDSEHRSPNVMRCPTHIVPLLGDFGPHATVQPDIDAALWVTTKQNQIHQLWAPLHTMFSRGNIGEKARILQIAEAETEQQTQWSVVDMYAGIGYFTFSYIRGGATKAIAFEINPWSVEGFKRGVEKNGWPKVQVVKALSFDDGDGDGCASTTNDITIFEMSNEAALTVITKLRSNIPPVRHVNCGLLPTSKNSWPVAVQLLDPTLGGSLHIHENFQKDQVATKADEVLASIQKLVVASSSSTTTASAGQCRAVALQHVERVKTFAPGIIHCVLDICISPQRKAAL